MRTSSVCFLFSLVLAVVFRLFALKGSPVAAVVTVAGLLGMSASLAVQSVNSPFMRRRMERND